MLCSPYAKTVDTRLSAAYTKLVYFIHTIHIQAKVKQL